MKHPLPVTIVVVAASTMILTGCSTQGDLQVQASETTLADLGVVHAIEIVPATGAILVAAHNGVWAIERDGAAVAAPLQLASEDLTDLAIVSDGTLYAISETAVGRGGGLVRSVDDGVSWSAGPTIAENVPSMLAASGHQLIAYFSSDQTVRTSVDGGESWTVRSSIELRTIAPDPTDVRTIFAIGDGGLLRSMNGGDDFEQIRDAPDLRQVAVLGGPEHDGGLIGATRDQRVWSRLSEQDAWRTTGHSTGAVATLAYASRPSPLLAIVDERGLALSEDLGYRWTVVIPKR